MVKEALDNINCKSDYNSLSRGATVSSSEIRYLIEKIFDSESAYTFFRTVGNPNAVKLLECSFGEREGSEPWVVKKRENS